MKKKGKTSVQSKFNENETKFSVLFVEKINYKHSELLRSFLFLLIFRNETLNST